MQILAIGSPVFKTMFSSEFKEAQTSEVNLPGKKIEEIGWLLDFLYPDSYCKLTGKVRKSCQFYEELKLFEYSM